MRKLTLQLALASFVGFLLSGCAAVGFFIPAAGVPKVPQTTVPESALVEVDMRVEQERRTGSKKTVVCVRGECENRYTKTSRLVNVDVAKASVNGRPVSIGEVATAYPDFVAQDRDIRDARSACTRGKIVMGVGVVGALVGGFLVSKGENENDRTFKTSGYAAIGAGVAVYATGWLLAGYRRCDDWVRGVRKWEGVYDGPSDTEVRGSRAQVLKKLAERVNAQNAERASRAPKPEKTPATPGPVDVTPPDSPDAPVDAPNTSNASTCGAALVSKGLEKRQKKADELCAKYTTAQIAKAEELVELGIRDSFSSLLRDVAKHTDEQIECAKKAWAADGKKRSFSVKKACR